MKCEKYWPDKSGVYGDITVTMTETKTFADYVTRMFTLKKVKIVFEYQKYWNIVIIVFNCH